MHSVALPIRAGRPLVVVLCGLETAEGADSKTSGISRYPAAQETRF